MAKFQVVPFEPAHLEKIEMRKEQGEGKPESVSGAALTFMLDGRPAAIVGGFCVVPKVLQVWAILSDDIKKHPFAFHRSIRAMLAWVIKERDLQRVQFTVKHGFVGGCKWAESLGFTQEGVMQGYGPGGTDYWLYGRTA